MEPVFAVVVGVLFACGTYLMLRRSLLRFVFGLILVSNGANLLIFTAGRLTRATPPLIPTDADVPAGAVANALPQALVLTAIVIGFGLTAFALVLLLRGYQALGTLDTDVMAQGEAADEAAATAAAANEVAPDEGRAETQTAPEQAAQEKAGVPT